MARVDVVVDVETIGPPWAELEEGVREYLAVRAYRDEWQRLDGDQQDAIIRHGSERTDRTALELGLAEIIAVGMWLVREDRGFALVRSPDPNAAPHDATCDLGPYSVGPERFVLEKTWASLGQIGNRRDGLRVVTYNGRAFDMPVLAVRSAQLGLRPSVNPAPYRFDLSEHCDLADVLTFWGATRGIYTLEWWCERFGIENPKTKVDGARVGELWREGKIHDVATYVLGDGRSEAALFRRLAMTILPHFKGGAGIDVGPAVLAGRP